jgi:hypothetical protein
LSKVEMYHRILKALADWEPFLLEQAHLPGKRSNLELMHAVADLGTQEQFERFLEWSPEKAKENTPETFVACCGVVGLGRLLAEGDQSQIERLRLLANDPRWRVREAVCMALQRWGRADMEALLIEMADWSLGQLLEQRAAAAGLCEPDLLHNPKHALAVLKLLDQITRTISDVQDRKSEAFRVLRKGLAYCWSVAVVALPSEGKLLFEQWLKSADKDVRWILKENLKKNRLARMDASWVTRCLANLEASK